MPLDPARALSAYLRAQAYRESSPEPPAAGRPERPPAPGEPAAPAGPAPAGTAESATERTPDDATAAPRPLQVVRRPPGALTRLLRLLRQKAPTAPAVAPAAPAPSTGTRRAGPDGG
ncbi:hypothetical protein [Streptomyces albireticuli]|uniref:hypothetical protein n=1 Tax=Streptomyces albireticuli TaxID=1940 RepID=UPI001E4C1FAF|nr:hypothetical protein [Streptomyces albireticuli]MCD9193513.1 hypothetical protein [Streptomyces albireticuli]